MSAPEISYDKYENLIGIPFVRGGRDLSTGVDCYGLVMEMYRRTGKVIPDFVTPEDLKTMELLIDRERGSWRKVEPRPGCLLLFRVEGYRAHVGFMLSHSKMIHSQEPMGVTVASRHFWPNIVAAYDYE